MDPEKAAYRGGCQSLPEPPEGAIRHGRRYHDHPASPARIGGGPADRDRARWARRMLAAALRAEADAFVAQHAEETLPDGRQRVVRHGYGLERRIQTGIGALEVRRPKVRDRAADLPQEKIRFTSAILPKWARRSKSLDALLPVLYLRGISTGDFQ